MISCVYDDFLKNHRPQFYHRILWFYERRNMPPCKRASIRRQPPKRVRLYTFTWYRKRQHINTSVMNGICHHSEVDRRIVVTHIQGRRLRISLISINLIWFVFWTVRSFKYTAKMAKMAFQHQAGTAMECLSVST